MLLEIGKIIHQPGGVVPFSLEMDFSELDFGGSHPATEPLKAQGQVRNEAGVLGLTADREMCIRDRDLTTYYLADTEEMFYRGFGLAVKLFSEGLAF